MSPSFAHLGVRQRIVPGRAEGSNSLYRYKPPPSRAAMFAAAPLPDSGRPSPWESPWSHQSVERAPCTPEASFPYPPENSPTRSTLS